MRKKDIIRRTIRGILRGNNPDADIMQQCKDVCKMQALGPDYVSIVFNKILVKAGHGINLPYSTKCNLAIFMATLLNLKLLCKSHNLITYYFDISYKRAIMSDSPPRYFINRDP